MLGGHSFLGGSHGLRLPALAFVVRCGCCLRRSEGHVGGPDDGPALVDPEPEGDVGESEQFDQLVGRVHQRRVGWFGCFSERPSRFDVGIEGHGYDGQSVGRELFVQCLPPGQVETAASIGRPGDEQHLSVPQRGQVELIAFEI